MSFYTSITPRFGGFYRVATLLFFFGLRLMRVADAGRQPSGAGAPALASGNWRA